VVAVAVGVAARAGAAPALELGSDELVAQLDTEDATAARVDGAHRAAMDAASAAAAAAADPGAQQAMNNILGRLQAKRLPARDTGHRALDAAVDDYRRARDELAAQRQRTADAVRAARLRAAEALQRTARDPLFREALTWQNRVVVRNTLDKLLEVAPHVDDAKARERRRVVAKYVQRYLLKNETIGFFGPIVWGSVDPTTAGFVATPGPSLVDKRVVSFEDWTIAAVAAQLSKDPEICDVFTPRRRPSSWLDGSLLGMPPGEPRLLTATEAWLVARVDGERSVRDIAIAAAGDPQSGVHSAEEATRELQRLGRENVITWGIEVPAELDHPERWLRARLERIADPTARARCLEPLDRLEAARARVAQAAGDPDALDARVAELESEFEALTGMSSKRGHGRMYVGRQTFFEDCRRAFDLRIGRAVLDRLAVPLTLILHSARWYTYEIARRFRVGFHEAYDRALAEGGERPLPLTTFVTAARGLFSPDRYHIGPVVAAVQRELQQRWGTILGVDPGDSATHPRVVRAADCRDRVAELFRAPCPGWPRARYHSPDLMIAAASADGIARGDFTAVLGEVHANINTLLTHVAYRMHPERDAIDDAYEADMAMVCVSPIQSEIGRATNSPLAPRDHHVEVGPTRSWRPRDHVHLAGDLYVERTRGRLRVRSRVRELDHDIVSFMEAYLSVEAAAHFQLLPPARHLPRVTIDRLVVSRERWSLEPAEFRALIGDAGGVEDQVRRVRGWARALGLPRCVFASVPHEPKPFYVDFGSPSYIDIFVRCLGDAARLAISEMLPGHDQLWLSDADGRSYTSELRFAAVDPERWTEAPGPLEDRE
jgi:hypothetical protein